MELETIIDRFKEAAETERRMPSVGPGGYRAFWPDSKDPADPPKEVQQDPPSHDDITRMEEAFSWLQWVEKEVRIPILRRAQGMGWSRIVEEYGRSTATWKRYRNNGLRSIQRRLEERFV